MREPGGGEPWGGNEVPERGPGGLPASGHGRRLHTDHGHFKPPEPEQPRCPWPLLLPTPGLPRGHCAHGLHPTGLASVMGSPGLDLRGSQLLTQQPPKGRGAREEMSRAGPASEQGATQLPENHLGEMFSVLWAVGGAGALGCRRHKGGRGRQGKGVERCWLPGALPTTLPLLQVSDQTGSSGSQGWVRLGSVPCHRGSVPGSGTEA